ncbi:hypothetical protein BDV93DRAFT_551893 [Ceratobasidium sp. AG-I]|nr:hypothetical protein BDV93DRAFT_551893 [Ceratobasidium sp. AG-I]
MTCIILSPQVFRIPTALTWVLAARASDGKAMGYSLADQNTCRVQWILCGDIPYLVTEAVRSVALRYLSTLLHSARTIEDVSTDTLNLDKPAPPDWHLTTQGKPLSASMDPVFYQSILQRVDILVVAFATNLSRVLRRMRHADEDTGHNLTLSTALVAFATNLSRVLRRMRHEDEDTGHNLTLSTARARQPDPHSRTVSHSFQPPRSGLGDFFNLIAFVYADRPPDAALRWWADSSDGRLYAFLRWAAEARVTPLLDLGGTRQPLPVDPDEIRGIMAFLRVLRVVVRYSTAARAALLENGQYRAVSVMLDLVRAHAELELKGRIFDTVAALCEAGDEAGVGQEIVKLMWGHPERCEVLTIRSVDSNAVGGMGGWKKSRGVLTELEEVEAPARQYPTTLAFVHLLNSLVRAPETVPDNLGSGRRVPGTSPYVRCVLDNALLKEYTDPAVRLRLTEASKAAPFDTTYRASSAPLPLFSSVPLALPAMTSLCPFRVACMPCLFNHVVVH